MKVSPINSNAQQQNFKGLNTGAILHKAANINSWQQRAALGVAAIALQPMIDLKNKEVDEETRRVSANRSFAKGLVGATTGIIIRGGCMKAIEQAFRSEKFTDTVAKYTAENKTQEAIEKSKDFIKNQGGAKRYAAAMGTIVAIGVMIFTNFAVDAPLTNKLTDKLNEKYEKDNPDKLNGSPAKEGA